MKHENFKCLSLALAVLCFAPVSAYAADKCAIDCNFEKTKVCMSNSAGQEVCHEVPTTDCTSEGFLESFCTAGNGCDSFTVDHVSKTKECAKQAKLKCKKPFNGTGTLGAFDTDIDYDPKDNVKCPEPTQPAEFDMLTPGEAVGGVFEAGTARTLN